MEREDEQSKAQNKSKLPEHATFGKVKLLGISLIPIVVLAAMIAYIVGPAQQYLGVGIPLPEVTIERIEFREGDQIVAFIRNTGPIDIAVAQADINDRIQPAAIEPSRDIPRLAEARVIIPFPWNAGEPYEIGITTSDGTRFSKSVEAAAPAVSPDIDQVAFFALVGTYVGIIPVLIGLLWLPFIRRLTTGKYNFFLALTAGLLVFLGIDALAESNEIAEENIAGVFDGTILIAMVMILSFLVLMYATARLGRKRSSDSADVEESTLSFTAGKHDRGEANAELNSKNMDQRRLLHRQLAKPLAIALMISIGIGLHNFGEGLAIGASVVLGEVALSTFLIVGFMVHNTTEGLAIVSPLAKVRVKKIIARLAVFGLIAGAPTIAGAWMGGFLYSPLAAIIFLSVGAGAIFQVVFSIFQWMARRKETTNRGSSAILSDPYIIGGFATGMLIMYVTGLMVPS